MHVMVIDAFFDRGFHFLFFKPVTSPTCVHTPIYREPGPDAANLTGAMMASRILADEILREKRDRRHRHRREEGETDDQEVKQEEEDDEDTESTRSIVDIHDLNNPFDLLADDEEEDDEEDKKEN